jgi:hypothetical protein
MAMSGDTFGFLESSWNRGILSRMAIILKWKIEPQMDAD